MSCLGVHFAITPDEAQQLRSIPDEQARLDFIVENLEESYFKDVSGFKAESDKSWDAMHRALSNGELSWDGGSYPLNHAVLAGELLYTQDDYIMQPSLDTQLFSPQTSRYSRSGNIHGAYASPMGYARKHLISLQDTPYYHVVSRCVRRAWLWGQDEFAGRDYSHRKQWVIDRIAELSSIFAIEICAYAVMSNHYHLVLYVDREKAKGWTAEEVIHRWSQLHLQPHLIQRYLSPDGSPAEREAAETLIATWRERLFDISWFMRHLNEYLARRANAEDDCTGRFWEGRFKSQALLDDAGILTAMAYVDLNPIRAGIAKTPEDSEFTSIYQRIRQSTATTPPKPTDERRIRLRRFADQSHSKKAAIPYTSLDYLQLVDWSGRSIREGKRGHIDATLPPILSRLSIDPEIWQLAMARKGTVLGRAMGRLDIMRLHAATLGQAWVRGLNRSERMYAR